MIPIRCCEEEEEAGERDYCETIIARMQQQRPQIPFISSAGRRRFEHGSPLREAAAHRSLGRYLAGSESKFVAYNQLARFIPSNPGLQLPPCSIALPPKSMPFLVGVWKEGPGVAV